MKIYYSALAALMMSATAVQPLMAQDDTQNETEKATAVTRKVTAMAPKYKMTKIEGKVIDASTGKPLPGVMVQTLGDKRFTAMSDEQGHFALQAPVFTTALYVHSVGYAALQVPVSHRGTISVSMLPEGFRPMYAEGTDITATKTMSEQATTAKTIETDIAAQLGGDVRTLTRSGSPGIGSAMFIRGLNSINANAQPLIVVDGVIQDQQYGRSSLHLGDYNNLLLNIDPEDIDQVTVLKNATALYGAKGGNGVILVKTKRGRSMATRIDAKIGVGMELVPRLPDMMRATDYHRYASELVGTIDGNADLMSQLHFLNDATREQGNRYYETYHNDTDWSKEVYHTAMTQMYNINVQGGDNVGFYNLAMGYTDGKSTLRDNGFDRLNARFNSDLNIVKGLTTRFDMSFTKVNRDVFDDGAAADITQSTITSPSLLALIKSPMLSPYKYDNYGHLSGTLADADDFLSPIGDNLSLANPTALLRNGNDINKNRVENTWLNVAVMPKWDITPYLQLSETFSYSLNRNSQRYYRPVGGVPSFVIEGIGEVSSMSMSLSSKENSIFSDTRLAFSKAMGRHHLDAMAGIRFTSFAFDNSIPQGQYAPPAGNDNNPGITTSMNFYSAAGDNEKWKNLAWYASAQYNYMNRYFVNLDLSMESSNRFGSEASSLGLGGVKWGVFPGVQLGWVLTNERWFPRQNVINYLQLNAGYDLSGNDDIREGVATTSFQVVKYLYESTGIQMNNIGNEHIKWEQTAKWNVGLRTWMLNNRLGLNLDLYHHHTTNLLALRTLDSPLGGVSTVWGNEASLDNNGLELSLSAKPIVSRTFNLEMGFSLGHYANKVKSLPNAAQLYNDGTLSKTGYTSSIYGTDNVATMVGESVGVFYGYKTLGVFASDAEAKAAGKDGYLYQEDNTGARQDFKAGDMHFADLNGDGKIDKQDRTIIGNPNPDIYGNIFATAQWKGLSLNIVFNYSLGNDIYNYQRSLLENSGNFYNQTTAVNRRWHYEGQTTDMPRAVYGDPMGNSRFSDRWIEDGSYLRLKRLNLSYKVPVPQSWSWLQGLTVWGEAVNLFTVTKYLGGDPEMAVANSVLAQGVDAGCVAQGRAFMFGLKVNL